MWKWPTITEDSVGYGQERNLHLTEYPYPLSYAIYNNNAWRKTYSFFGVIAISKLTKP